MSQVQRKRLLVGTGLLLGAPFAFAQTQKHARIGILSSQSSLTMPPGLQQFPRAMGKLGWVEGRNLSVEWRLANGVPERTPKLASELVALGVQVIVTSGDRDDEIAHRATQSIPIVALSVIDPVKLGFARSLAHPGGNMTGVFYSDTEFAGKVLQLLKEALPGIKRVAYLYFGDVRTQETYADASEAAARALGVTLLRYPITQASDIGPALAAAKASGADALRVATVGAVTAGMDEILAFAAATRIPSYWSTPRGVERGGFMSYSPDYSEVSTLGAAMVDQILKGANPAEMPFQYPTRYQLVINLKTARQLGITVPQAILGRADRVIE